MSPATASAHLARLLDGGLVTVVSQGRHRYYRLAGHQVAAAIEALSHLGPPAPVRSLRRSRQAEALVRARTCYDHLAGQAGVALLDALLAGGILVAAEPEPAGGVLDGTGEQQRASGAAPRAQAAPAGFDVTAAGESTLGAFGVDVSSVRRSRRRFAGPCLDWTERRPHTALVVSSWRGHRCVGLSQSAKRVVPRTSGRAVVSAPARSARPALPGCGTGRRSAPASSWNWVARTMLHGTGPCSATRSWSALTR